MRLFGEKKKEQKQESLPQLKFPELPSMMESPAYEQTAMKEAAAIRQAVMPKEMMKQEVPGQQMAAVREKKAEQPLFIKVDAYKEVVDTLSVIRSKLVDANHILDELTKLKEEEDSNKRETNASRRETVRTTIMPPQKDPAKQENDVAFHVMIAEPTAVRRTVLNLALDSIQLMKRYDRLMAIRSKKQATRSRLNNIYREIKKISGDIKLKELPGMQKPKQEPKVQPLQKLTLVKATPEMENKPLIKKPVMSPLEKEMDEIRRKLSSI